MSVCLSFCDSVTGMSVDIRVIHLFTHVVSPSHLEICFSNQSALLVHMSDQVFGFSLAPLEID